MPRKVYFSQYPRFTQKTGGLFNSSNNIDDYFSSGFLEQPVPNFKTTLEQYELFECLTPDCPISPELDILTKSALQNNFISSEESQLQDPNDHIDILDTPMPFYGTSSTAPAPMDIFPLDCPMSLDHPDVINFLDNLLNMSPSADVNNPFSNLISNNIEFNPNLIDSSNLNLCHQMLESTALQPTVKCEINIGLGGIVNENVIKVESAKKRTVDQTMTSQPLNDHNYSTLEKKVKMSDNILGGIIDGNTEKIIPDDVDDDGEDDSLRGSSFGPHIKIGTSKYMERRKKNNVASKRSRETRKSRFVDMEKQAEILEKQNEELRKRISMLEQMTMQMKEVLVKKLKGSG